MSYFIVGAVCTVVGALFGFGVAILLVSSKDPDGEDWDE